MVLERIKKNQISPQLTLVGVWKILSKKPAEKSDQDHRVVFRKLQYFDPATREGILNDLLQIERESLRQNDRLRYVRKKTMDLVDRRAAADNLRRMTNHDRGQINSRDDNDSDRRLELALADCDIQIAVLRAYTMGKYGDRGRDDWFCMYSYLTELFSDHVLTESTAKPAKQFFFAGRALEATKENFQLCRDKCLNANIGQQFDIRRGDSHRLLIFLRNLARKPVWRKLIS